MLRSELEKILEQGLGIAGATSTHSAPVERTDQLLLVLQHRISDLGRTAKLIGAVPEDYPKHVRFVIRAIASLLPWYTRPLRHFAQVSTETCALMALVLGGQASSTHRSENPGEARS